MGRTKKWYEREQYINFKPSTPEEWGRRVWNKFQEELDRRGYDNSMGDNNYLIGMILMDMVNASGPDAFVLIEEKIQKRLDNWEEDNF